MIYLVVGRREQGKTTLAYHMASRLPERVIFDPRGNIRHGLRVDTASEYLSAIKRMRLRVRDELPPSNPLVMDAEIRYAPPVTEVVYTPRGDSQAGFEVFACGVQEWVREDFDRPLAVLIDEIAFADLSCEPFKWVARCCARERVQIILTCHRPSDIDTSTRAISDHWLLFPCRQEHDLEVIRRRCSERVATEVQQLERRQFVHWDDTAGHYKVVRNAASWHVELSPHPEAPRPPGASITGALGGEDSKNTVEVQPGLDL